MVGMNPLVDLIPARARKYVYGIILLSALVFGAWQASEGNITVFIGSVIAALVNALALSHTNTSPTVVDMTDGHQGELDLEF